MKYIKLAAISFLLLFLLVMAISFFIPNQVRISRAINISATKDQVRPYLNDLTKWNQWNLFVTDSLLKKDAVSSDVIKAGSFTVELLPSQPDSILTNWNNKGKDVMSGLNLIEAGNGITIVQWYFDIKLNWYPWEKISSIVFDKQYGPLMEQSLGHLKTKAEFR